MRRRRRAGGSGADAQQGSIAVEFGIAIPVLMLVLLGGTQLGRVLLIRHRLEDATAYAARSAAVAKQTDQGTVHRAVLERMGTAGGSCANINVAVAQIPGATEDVQGAIEVTSTCALNEMIKFPGVPQVEEIKVVAAMPLDS
jgi:Flp pilus assembly protein TadG